MWSAVQIKARFWLRGRSGQGEWQMVNRWRFAGSKISSLGSLQLPCLCGMLAGSDREMRTAWPCACTLKPVMEN